MKARSGFALFAALLAVGIVGACASAPRGEPPRASGSPRPAAPSPAPTPEPSPSLSPGPKPAPSPEPTPTPSPAPSPASATTADTGSSSLAVTPDGLAAIKAVLRVCGRAWTTLGVGSLVESRTQTVLANGRRVESARETQTLLAREGERVTIRWQLGPQTRDLGGEIHSIPGDDERVQAIELAGETLDLPAGKFECRHFRATYVAEGVLGTTDVWVSARVPVAVRTVEANPRETTTTTLERCVLTAR